MQNNNDRYGFEFYFKDGGWNIIMFNEKGQCHAYYTCDEHDIDRSIQHLEDYVDDPENIYRYSIPTYDEFDEKTEDIFSLKNGPIETLSDYSLPANK